MICNPTQYQRQPEGKVRQHQRREDEASCGDRGVWIQPPVSNNSAEGIRRPKVVVPEEKAARDFEVEDTKGPVLHEVNDVLLFWSEVGVKGHNEIRFH